MPSLLFSGITFQINYLHLGPCPKVGFGGTQTKRVLLEQGFPQRPQSELHSVGSQARPQPPGVKWTAGAQGAKCTGGTYVPPHSLPLPDN